MVVQGAGDSAQGRASAMSDIIDLLTRADPSQIGQDADHVIYEDKDVRAKSTNAIELAGNGLLAVLEDGIHVSFVVLRWASGDNPILWEPVFSGNGPSGPGDHGGGGFRGLRELRHTHWGENGYLFYAPGALIADAFAKLERWFDCNEGS